MVGIVLASALLPGCGPGPVARPRVDTGADDTVGDSGVDSDAETGDTAGDSNDTEDTDTHDTGEPALPGVALDAIADAVLIGEEAGDGYLGFALAGGQDLDGDGAPDLLIGVAGHTAGGTGQGAAYVVSGPVLGGIELSTASVKALGSLSDYAGYAVASVGDVTGDGHADALAGSPLGAWENDAGRVFLLDGPVTGALDLPGDEHAMFDGELHPYSRGSSYTGDSLAGVGDTNGDGIEDILIGASCYYLCSGAAYLFLGPLSGTYAVTDAELRIYGDVGSLGSKLASAGDIDGDGLPDVMMTGGNRDVIVLLSPMSGVLAPQDADASIYADENHYLGYSLAPAGDVNHDGYADLLLGDSSDSDEAPAAGAVYVVLGPVAGDNNVHTTAVAKLAGDTELEGAGDSLASGDFDGDGHRDILVGAPGYYDSPGAAYVVLGPVAGTGSLADAHAILRGDGEDEAGSEVANVGDMDGDGLDDLLIAGPGGDEGGDGAGAAWLVSGGSLW